MSLQRRCHFKLTNCLRTDNERVMFDRIRVIRISRGQAVHVNQVLNAITSDHSVRLTTRHDLLVTRDNGALRDAVQLGILRIQLL